MPAKTAWPDLGRQPPNYHAHAYQLKDDIQKLIVVSSAKGPNPFPIPLRVLEPLFQSILELISKGENRVEASEVLTQLQKYGEAQKSIQADVAVLKTAADHMESAGTRPNGQPKTWADVTRGSQSSSRSTSAAQTGPAPKAISPRKEREVTLYMKDKGEIESLRRYTPLQIVKKVNAFEEERGGTAKVAAARQLPSGDVVLNTYTPQQAEAMRTDKTWAQCLGTDVRIHTPMYGVMMHGVPVRTIENIEEEQRVDKMMKGNKHTLPNAEIRHASWLKRSAATANYSTLIVDFASPTDANEAIDRGLIWDGAIYECELYDPKCRMIQCFKCQKYGHKATHCRGRTACAYCGGGHSSKECTNKEKPGAEGCPACGGKGHTAYNERCPARQAERARLKEAFRFKNERHPVPGSEGAPTTKSSKTLVTSSTDQGAQQSTKAQARNMRKPPAKGANAVPVQSQASERTRSSARHRTITTKWAQTLADREQENESEANGWSEIKNGKRRKRNHSRTEDDGDSSRLSPEEKGLNTSSSQDSRDRADFFEEEL